MYSFLFFLLSVSVFAQNPVLKGKIIDAHTAQPLVGAKIVTEEGAMTTSDEEGLFRLSCATGLQLRVSFVGYEKYSVEFKGCQQFLNIALVPATSNLDEVRLLSDLQPEGRSLEEPVSEVKLNRIELQRGTGLFLDDAINANVPGVTMQRRAVASGQQFNIRGYGNGVGFRGASNNFDGQGYK
ncbi:MAG: carboxypeptidase-like regulatory domain-containing protein, partial [Salegentibacter sp.]